MRTTKRRRRAMIQLSRLLVVAGASGCKQPVEVKNDTPQATVASVVKMYEKEDFAKLGTVLHPVVVRGHARSVACTSVVLATRSRMSDCTCGEAGWAAASKATTLAPSGLHTGLRNRRLSTSTCTIKDAADSSAKGLTTVNREFWTRACADLEEKGDFSVVTAECGKQRIQFLLAKQPTGWQVVGFDENTEMDLWLEGSAADTHAGAKQKESDLNKDMK